MVSLLLLAACAVESEVVEVENQPAVEAEQMTPEVEEESSEMMEEEVDFNEIDESEMEEDESEEEQDDESEEGDTEATVTTGSVAWSGTTLAGIIDHSGTLPVEATLTASEENSDDLSGGSVSAIVKMTGLTSDNNGLTNHLKGADFFDVENHAEATFQSTSISKSGEGYEVVGDLTIMGATQSITLQAREEAGEWVAEYDLNIRDFNVENNKAGDMAPLVITLKKG